MHKKIIMLILILIFIIGIWYSYNIIEGIKNKELKEKESPLVNRFKELNNILIGGEKDNKKKISINVFFSKLTPEKCKAVKEMIDLVNTQFSEEPGKGSEELQKQINTEMAFSEWAAMFSLIVTANIGTTVILKKDNKCGILNYINSLEQKGYTLDIGFPNIGGGGAGGGAGAGGSNESTMNFGF